MEKIVRLDLFEFEIKQLLKALENRKENKQISINLKVFNNRIALIKEDKNFNIEFI